MPTIKFKKEAVQQLVDDATWSTWLSNLKSQWVKETEKSSNGYSINDLEEMALASDLVLGGFIWDESNEGSDYWSDYYHKLLELE